MGEDFNSSTKAHHAPGGRFRNPWPSFGFESNWRSGMSMFLRDFDRNRCKITEEVKTKLATPMATPLEQLKKPENDRIQVTWVGHATFLIQFDRVNVLTDPVWSDRCSPTSLIGPKRYVPVPFKLTDLPPIDIVIISHNHYDHLDESTVKVLGNKPLYLVPLGLKKQFQSWGLTNVVELDWWEDYNVCLPDNNGQARSIKAICTPSQHFSGRGILDRNKTLWCSWVLEGRTKKIYFAGDTGFCTVPKNSIHTGGVPEISGMLDSSKVCPIFDEIGKHYGPFDSAFIPIGAYSPRYFMSPIHCSPEDAVAIHKAVQSKLSIAMHWGTFVLTDEPLLEPPVRLTKELSRLKIDASSFITMKHGETRCF